jgi:hypothetical protein
MAQGVGSLPEDRVKTIEQELILLRTKLRQTTNQVSFLQVLLLLFLAAVCGGGYYLVKEGVLWIEGVGPPAAKVLNSKEFGFYNRSNTRTWFATDDKFGDPEIIFLNPNKQLQMRLKVWPEEEGGGGLSFYDEQGWRGQFRMGPDLTSLLTMRGQRQMGGVDLTVDVNGNSHLKMFGKKGKGGVDIKVDAEGKASLAVADQTGKVIWQAPTTASASP